MHSARIKTIKYSLASSASIRRDSAATVTTTVLYQEGKPADNGPCDAHLGSTDLSYACATCRHSNKKCLGHTGHLELKYPVFSPVGLSDMKRWLRIICHSCGAPVAAKSVYEAFDRKLRFYQAANLAKVNGRQCVSCRSPIVQIKRATENKLFLVSELYVDKHLIERKVLFPHIVEEIFARVAPETVTFFARHIHPSTFILRCITVPPTSLRPDTKKLDKSASEPTNGMTPAIVQLMRQNELMPETIKPDDKDELISRVYAFVTLYYSFVITSGNDNVISLATTLKGKKGYLRRNVLGRHVHYMCRSTIIGNPRIKIDEVSIPLVFAQTVPVSEVVQDYSRARLMEYVQNGKQRYPGALSIRKKDGNLYDIEHARDMVIENGDIVNRDMVNGDMPVFNRQPTLTVLNVSGHYARINCDPDNMALEMNPSACGPYAADFDGDLTWGAIILLLQEWFQSM